MTTFVRFLVGQSADSVWVNPACIESFRQIGSGETRLYMIGSNGDGGGRTLLVNAPLEQVLATLRSAGEKIANP